MNFVQTGPIFVDPILVTEVLVGILLGKLVFVLLSIRFPKKKVEIKKIDWFWLAMSFNVYATALCICVHIDQVPIGVRWFWPVALDLATLMFLSVLRGYRA